MAKYIDAEKLMTYLNKTMQSYKSKMVDPRKFPIDHIDLMAFLAREYQAIIANVISLQQEQPESSKGKFVFPKFLYARTVDNKTIDVSYAPQNMEAVEYVRSDFIEQGQTKVDLEKEDKNCLQSAPLKNHSVCKEDRLAYARHFYELGKNSK